MASGGETWRVEASGGEERFDQGDEVFEIGQQELQGLATARRIWKGWAAGMVFVLKTEMYSHFFLRDYIMVRKETLSPPVWG